MAGIVILVPEAGIEMPATLNDSRTSRKLLDSLPLEGEATRWGDEVYFVTPVDAPAENPVAAVPSGSLAYWPPGKAFCVFFGQTPYSPVNLLGAIDGDEALFGQVRSGQIVRIEEA